MIRDSIALKHCVRKTANLSNALSSPDLNVGQSVTFLRYAFDTLYGSRYFSFVISYLWRSPHSNPCNGIPFSSFSSPRYCYKYCTRASLDWMFLLICISNVRINRWYSVGSPLTLDNDSEGKRFCWCCSDNISVNRFCCSRSFSGGSSFKGTLRCWSLDDGLDSHKQSDISWLSGRRGEETGLLICGGENWGNFTGVWLTLREWNAEKGTGRELLGV